MRFASHEAYFSSVSDPEAQARLLLIRDRVQAVLPEAAPCISYSMPAFRRGKVFFYFAAFKQHIGVYPPLKDLKADASLHARIAPYRGPKGNLSFPLKQALPIDLIVEVALALAGEYAPLPAGDRQKTQRH